MRKRGRVETGILWELESDGGSLLSERSGKDVEETFLEGTML